MKKLVKILLYVILVAAAITASFYFYANSTYLYLVQEDGVFEDITAIVLLLISILFLVRLIKEHKSKNKYWIALSIIIIIGTFLGCGEEISWGQRIFSIKSDAFFAANNLQGETNLHNLEIDGVKLNKVIFTYGLEIVFGFYFFFTQLLYKYSSFSKKVIDLWGLPIPRIKHTIVLLLCTGVIVAVSAERVWELWEAMFVTILLLVFIDPYNKSEKLI